MSERVEITWPSSGVEAYSKSISEIYGGGQSKPFLLSVSNVSRAINESKNFENSSIDITLSNLKEYFSLKMSGADQYIKGATAEYYIDDILFFRGKISKLPRCVPEEFRITVDTYSSGLDLAINEVIKKTEFPNVPAANEGKYGNLIYGTADDTGGGGEGMAVAYRVDDEKYLAAWHHLSSLISVFDSEKVDITAECILENNADGRAYILFSNSAADLEIYFNAYGREEGSVLIENPASILAKINSDFGSFVIDGISESEAIYTARAYTNTAVVINNDLKWGEFFKNFSINFDSLIFKQANGNMKIKVLEWGSQESSMKLEKQYISYYMAFQDIEDIIDEYRRMYWFHFRKGYFHRLPTDIEADSFWESKTGTLDLRYSKGDETSRDIAAGIIFFKKNKLIWHQAKADLRQMIGVDLGDVIMIQWGKGLFPDQFRMIQVYRISVSGAARWIEIEGLDISEINQGLITLLNSEDTGVHILLDAEDADVGVLL
jgi:hypothetical protein